MIIIGKVPVDFEGYSQGDMRDLVGTFDSYEEADKWVEEHPEYKPEFYRTKISIRELTGPDEWRPRQ